MLAIVTKLAGRKATYATADFTPNAAGEVRTYGRIEDDLVRAWAAQQHGGQPADYDITRPDAA